MALLLVLYFCLVSTICSFLLPNRTLLLYRRNGTRGVNPKLMHLDSKLEEVVQAIIKSGSVKEGFRTVILPLALSLRLPHGIAPDVDTMSPDKNGACVWVLLDSLLQAILQVLLMGGVLNDGNRQSVEVAHVATRTRPRNRLDLLNVGDGKRLSLADERAQNRGLRVGMDTRSGAALGEGSHEKRRARRRLEVLGSAEIALSRKVHDKHVVRNEALLLDSRWRKENVIMVVAALADGNASAGTGHPAVVVKVPA